MPTKLTIEEVADWSGLRAEWKSLVEADPHSTIFQSWEWISYHYKHNLIEAPLKLLAVRDRAGELHGVVPLLTGKKARGLRKYALFGGDYLDVVARRESVEEVAETLLAYLANTRSKWDMVDLRSQRSESAMISLIKDLPDANFTEARATLSGLSVVLLPHQRYPCIALPKTWPEYEQRLSKKFRWQMGYDARKRDREAVTTLRCATQQTLHADLQALFDLHQARWTSKEHAGIFASQDTQKFHSDFAAALLAEDKLRLYTLRMNDEPVAALECFAHNGTVCYYQGGFHPDYAVYSPAKALIVRAIQDAIRDGCTTFDFLKGNEEYKVKWCDGSRQTYRLLLCPRRPVPYAALQMMRLQPQIKEWRRSRQKGSV